MISLFFDFPMPAIFERKLTTRDALAQMRPSLSGPVVFTNGVFDILHRGHVTYLADAKALGACLIVGVNSDASVRRLGKGDDRPINTKPTGWPCSRRWKASIGWCASKSRRRCH
jgi:cytidyltransferase-like protein